MNTEEQWTCPTCSSAVMMSHCASCGERKPHPEELTFTGLSKQALEAFTSYDSRLLTTFRALLMHPGSLTLKYQQGSRKPYLGPFALFLLLNVLFVALEALVSSSNVFASSLATNLNEQPWSFFAPQLVNDRLAETGRTMEAYAPIFDRVIVVNAKAFIFSMVVPFALLPALLYFRRRLPFAVHLAYSLHFHAFMLVALCVMLLVIMIDVAFGGPGLASQLFDNTLAAMLLVVCGIYLYLSAAVVYRASGLLRLVQTALMISMATVVFLGYRFALFIYTLYTT
jgi:hypothetical protein